MRNLQYLLFAFILLCSCSSPGVPPAPIDPIPSEAQVTYQRMEMNGFVHFNMNTFSNMEWGYGDEKPSQFNPSALDARQWVRIMKEAGMKGVVITAKHHDGFCLWPSEYTEHSVKNSPWKDGKGDVIKDLREACDEYGLKLGVYLSPWDRNHKDYGTPEYITYFRNQLRELLTNYGEIFEVWFDGANGGDGYYGGENAVRKVDKLTYYDWENTYKIIYELQPKAIIFSDAGPGSRWIGNEHGFAYQTTWSMLMKDSVYGGMPEYAKEYASGQENGTHWVPGESDVSIRPGWYYHEYEDHKVRSLASLMEIYYKSVGQNSTLLLNFPVDKRGLIHEKDEEQVLKMGAKIKEDFAVDFTSNASVSCDVCRGTDFCTSNVIDDDVETYWAALDGQTEGSITIKLAKSELINRVLLQEHIPIGQRVKRFTVEVKDEGDWTEVASETTIGYKRILRIDPISAREIRINILDARACPTISNIGLYNAPPILTAPEISRSRAGLVMVSVPEEGPSIHYTLDGSTPTTSSEVFEKAIELPRGGMVKAISNYEGKVSEVSISDMDVSTGKWSTVGTSSDADKVLDGLHNTWWAGSEIVINLNEKLGLKGFTYLPTQQRYPSGFIDKYEFYTSLNGRQWKLASRGEFANILNSPITQRISFDKTMATHIKLKAVKTIDGKPASFAEFGILTK